MFSIQKASSLICTIVVALSSVGSAAAQGLDLTLFVGRAFPIYNERLTLAPPTPSVPGADVTVVGSPLLKADGGPVYGGALAFYPSEDFGLEVLVTRTPIKFRLEEPFSSFDAEQHFTPSAAYQAVASLLWSPIHAKFKFSESTIVHGDIFAMAGAGRTFHESVLGLTWEAGFGLKLYFSRFVTFRLELRDFLIPQEVLGRGRSTNNLTILGGLSLWFG